MSLRVPHGNPMVVAIRELVARRFGVEPEEILHADKQKSVSRARLVAYYLARKHTERSYNELGNDFLRDHATVLSGCRRGKQLVETDERVRARVEAIEAELAHVEALQ